MVAASDFRNGLTFDMDGNVFQVVEFQHVKPGKGAAFVRAKIRNVMSGSIVERTFNPSDKFENARIDRKEMQFSYKEDELYFFMDNETFDMIPINASSVGDALKFVKENETCKILTYKEKVFGIEAPIFVELLVIDTEPGFKGDTATGATKPATVETGAMVKVPLFVNIGDKIKIDTRTEEYMARA